MRQGKPKAIDLFSGCGGLSVGLERAGFRVVAAVDSDELAVTTYQKNHPDTHVIQRDIRRIYPAVLLKRLGLRVGELDLLAGCPPCQGFSTLRTLNGARSIDEPMNDLVFAFLRFVRIMRPRAVMLENVPGLLTDARLKRFVAVLESLGYLWRADLFDAANYGVPQRRRRMILIAMVRRRPEFANPARKMMTVRDTIGALPRPERSRDPVHNYDVTRAPHVLDLIRKIPRDGGSRSSLPTRDQLPCHNRVDGFSDIYGRMAWRQTAPTITGGCINPSKGRFLHPVQDRAITLREAAMLQGFPKGYVFDVSRGRYPTAQLIGNAFPPTFAALHARALLRQLGYDRSKKGAVRAR